LTVTTPTIPTTVTTPPTTAELLHAAAGGDQLAWRELVRRFEPIVAGTTVELGLQPADARDAAQRTWLQMVENHSKIRKPDALGGWLRTTARHECLRIIRERRRLAPLDPLDDAAGDAFPDAGVDVEQAVVDADTVRRLRRLIATLPPRSAVLLTALFHDEPPGYTELARLTGIPVGSIGPTRGRALDLLRRLFEADAPRVPGSRPAGRRT
jgi:RNA polymerase sigma factor (sigma-70 family)